VSWQTADGPSRWSGTSSQGDIRFALEAVWKAVKEPRNAASWSCLEKNYGFERIELFDMCWWTLIHAECVNTDEGWRLPEL